jgi:hypothetical protein
LAGLLPVADSEARRKRVGTRGALGLPAFGVLAVAGETGALMTGNCENEDGGADGTTEREEPDCGGWEGPTMTDPLGVPA